jgi:peptidoglycan hydrolase-like protein with peptidoglycan-binding domain
MILKRGMKSTEVALVQNALNQGTSFSPPLVVDGDYGPRTEERVRQFQREKGLSPDGTVGPLTLNELFTGVQLTGIISIRPAGPTVSLSENTPQTSLSFSPDSRDAQWQAEMQAWLDWAAKPFPRGTAPPLPQALPPSLNMPQAGPTLLPLPSQRLSPPPNQREVHPVPLLTGGNFELSTSAGLKGGKVKPGAEHLFNFKLDFARITGLIASNAVSHEVDVSQTPKGGLEIEHKISVTPFKLFSAGGSAAHVKAVPLLMTSLQSALGLGLFAGVKGVVTLQPFGQGFTIQVGGKLGPKLKFSHDEDGKAAASVYPLAGEGTLEFEFRL